MVTITIRFIAATGLAGLALLAAGCGSSGQVSLARLVANQDAYVGKQVTTSGRVEKQTNANGTHYYILADSQQDLVILTPTRLARPYVGRAVSISGRFGFDPRAGRVIRIASIAVRH